MFLQVLCVFAAASCTFAAKLDSPDYIDPNPSYAVTWEVKNAPTYDEKSQQETLVDGTVEGQYSYLRPDGKMQIVTYRANDDIGFVVDIDVQDVMPPFGDAGRPDSAPSNFQRAVGLAASSSPSVSSLPSPNPLFSSSTSSRSPFSSPSSSLPTSPSSSSGFSSASSTQFVRQDVNRQTSSGKTFLQGSNFDASSSRSPGGSFITSSYRTSRGRGRAFSSPSSSSSTNSINKLASAQRVRLPQVPVLLQNQQGARRQPGFVRPSTNFNVRPRTTRPPPPPPTTTTTTTTTPAPTPPPPPPPPPTPVAPLLRPLGVNRQFSGRVRGQTTGVAHVTFNSPTHQYSYPLVVS